jgi:hypothetical protein
MKRLHLSKETLTVLSTAQTQVAAGGTLVTLAPSVLCVNQVTQNPNVCFLVPIPVIPIPSVTSLFDGPRPHPW